MKMHKIIFSASLVFSALAFGACTVDKSDDSPLTEFGMTQTEFKVKATAGHIDIELLSNQECTLAFAEPTAWARLSKDRIIGDSRFFIDYGDNTGYPRMAKVIVDARPSGRCDTIVLKQYGAIEPTLTFAAKTLIVSGSADATDGIGFTTNVDTKEIRPEVLYEEGADEWISDIRFSEEKLMIDYAKNPSNEEPRSATLKCRYRNGWDEIQEVTLFILQKNARDILGREVSFEEVRALGASDMSVDIDDYLILTGYVVSDKTSGNVGDNPKTATNEADYTGCLKTIYLESLDGKYGFCVETVTEETNIFNRYDKVSLLLNGLHLFRQDNPERYTISGLTTDRIVSQEAGSAADIPIKERHISGLTDADIYTFVTLKDCEFPIRKGPLTPLNEGFTLGKGSGFLTKYPRLMRDIEGESIYLYTNTTCIYRRNGMQLPYGSGNISGVVVFELFPSYVYGDGDDEETHGNIGRYQLRHMAYDDIQFQEEESFSALLTEYRYRSAVKQDNTDKNYYWYPTTGKNGRFMHSAGKPTYPLSTFNYIGWVGTKNGIEPFYNHVGLDATIAYPLGYPFADGEIFKGSINEAGDGKVGSSKNEVEDGWRHLSWWNAANDKPYAWRIEFSTQDIQTEHLSMQFSVVGGVTGSVGKSPYYWIAQWSTTGDLQNDQDWKDIGSYCVPDGTVSGSIREWQLSAMKQIDMPLPLEMLGREKVYIRLMPASKITNTLEFGNGTIENGTDSGNCMDYFAIRYNK